MEKILILDRDGVICKSTPRGTYLLHLSQFELVPGIQELVCSAKNKGYAIVVATNQPQIAKGMLTVKGLHEIHRKMLDWLPEIDLVLHCPHKGEDGCFCRKPKPGMLVDAAERFNVKPTDCIFVGDSDKDIHAGKAFGCKTVFLNNEHNFAERDKCNPDYRVDSLEEIIPLL